MPYTAPAWVNDSTPAINATNLLALSRAAAAGYRHFDVMHPDYGAVGDGTTNDEPAIQAAVDAANAAGGGIVYLPEATYAISNPIDMKANVSLIGAGMNVTTIQLKSGQGANFASTFLVRHSSLNQNSHIRDLTLDGNARSGTSSDQGGGLGPAGFWTVERVRFYDQKYFKTYFADVDNVRFRNCRFDGTSDGADCIGGGTLSGNQRNVIVEGCYFASDIDGNVIDFTGGQYYVIRNNYSEANNIFLEAVTESVVENNVVKSGGIIVKSNSGYSPTNLIQAKGMVIRGNILDTPDDIGITLSYTDYASASTRAAGGGNIVAGNVVRNPPKVGILVEAKTGANWKTMGDVIVGNVVVSPNSDNTDTVNTGNATYKNAGIVLGGGVGDVVQGNSVTDIAGNMEYGYQIGSNGTYGIVDKAVVSGNNSLNHTVAGLIIDAAASVTASHIRGNRGFNPQGVASITVTASPFTYTNNDHVPEFVSIRGGTVSDVTKNGNQVWSTSNVGVWLEPGEAVVVTYSSAPDMKKDRK